MKKRLNFKIINNTDSVDIDQKSLGLNITFTQLSKMHNNRGLHIQIRHNKDKKTFNKAVEVSKLLAALPDLLEVCNHAIKELMKAYKMTKELEMQDHKYGATLNELVMRLNEEIKNVRNKVLID